MIGRMRVQRTENCIAARKMDCTNCTRVIGMGMSYLRVIILTPDEDGLLVEVKRMTLCLYCSTAWEKDHK